MKQRRYDDIISADPALANRYGFIKKRSTEDVIGQMIFDVENAKSRHDFVALLSLDLKSAYDLVSHVDLLLALDEFLERNNRPPNSPYLFLFCNSWLKNRRIIFENTSFSPTQGVPQGSPCSCSFFVIFFNYNPSSINSNTLIHPYFFADDANCVVSSPNFDDLQDSISHILSEVQSWCEDNNMLLSLEKCKVMWFQTQTADIGIENALNIKVLGVKIDNKLNFDEHIASIIDYLKRFIPPLRYLVKLGLCDQLARQFALTLRCKIVYCVFWLFKITATRLKIVETWWCNVLRATFRARNQLSRCYVFAAAGVPDIRHFAEYLLTKRAYFWSCKNLKTRPFVTISQAYELSNDATPANTNQLPIRAPNRPSTIRNTQESWFNKCAAKTNTTNSALLHIANREKTLFSLILNSQNWPDGAVRRRLGANCEKMWNLWDKSTRIKIFEKYTPKFEPENTEENDSD